MNTQSIVTKCYVSLIIVSVFSVNNKFSYICKAKQLNFFMMAAHNELGKWGEDLAAVYLQQKGHLILERNWRFHHKEIDIISLDTNSQTLCFVEVKTRRDNKFAEPEEAVTITKLKYLRTAATCYMRIHPIGKDAQIDVIGIIGTPQTGYKINHTQDVRIPERRDYRRYYR